jgi:hypothetical protein
MNATVLFMIKKCVCVCVCVWAHARARMYVCTWMCERTYMHTQEIIFKVDPPSSDDSANHLFPVLLQWGFRPFWMWNCATGWVVPDIQRQYLLWKNGKHSPNTGSHPRRPESLAIPLRLPHVTFIFFQMLHPTASIFSPTFQKYPNLISQEFFRNDVKVHML